MPRLKDGLSFKPLLSFVSAVVFHHAVVFLLLTRCCAGQSQVDGPIVATVGDDVILPCHLDPTVDASVMTVEWTRPDLNPRFVYVWRDGAELESKKHPVYRGRTSAFIDKLKHGNVSLKLSKVKLCDEGKYRCFVPTLGRESTVQLVVGVVDSSELVLQCESKGWYPEPEVLWLDGEGNLLPAGPTETVRGPGDLYTVSSRVTVEKRHSNNFTCRVQQKNINQIRESGIQILDDAFMAPSSTVRIIVVLCVLGLLIFSAAFLVFWKYRRQKKSNNKMHHDDETEDATGERKQLVEGRTKMKDFNEEGLQEKEGEMKDLMNMVQDLMEQKKEQEITRKTLMSQLEEVERERGENEKKLRSIKIEILKKKKLTEVKLKLDNQKTEYEKFLQTIEKILKTTEDVITIITARKNKVHNQTEQMKKQPEETKTQKDAIELRSEQTDKRESLHTT